MRVNAKQKKNTDNINKQVNTNNKIDNKAEKM